MKLEVHERIVLLELLPKEGDYAGMKAIRRAREMIGFTPEERDFFELRNDGGQIQWNTLRASEKIGDIPVDEYITNLIRDALSALNKKKGLEDKHMSLFEKFIVMYQ